MTTIDTVAHFLAISSNIAMAVQLLRQSKKHRQYKESVHALLLDDGHVENEPQLIVDETLRMTAHLGKPEPSAHDFAHGMLKQRAFCKAVAHQELHLLYVDAFGKPHEED